MLAAGTRLGRYEVLFPIASGGMATVYAARVWGEGRFRKPVALKVPLPTLAAQPRFRDMLMDEATLSACVTSPHVVSTIDLVRDGATIFLVMELVVGVGLRALERRFAARSPYAFPIPVAVAILAQAARGLHDAHEARDARGEPMHLVHRDVSPHNILVGADGRVRVTDFGIAHAAHRLTTTRTGETKGKLAYFAPEQLVGERVDRRLDVFALGVVAYELLTGVRPFEADNPLAIALNVAQKAVPPVTSLRPEVPTEVSDLIRHAMTRERERRLPTCAAFADRLEACVAAASREAIAALVRTEHGARIAAFDRALALAADAEDIAAVADQLGTTVSAEEEDGGVGLEGAPTVVRSPDLASVPPPAPPAREQTQRPRASEFELDDPPEAKLELDTRAPERAPAAVPTLSQTPEPARPPYALGAVSALLVLGGLATFLTLGPARGLAMLLLLGMVAGAITWWRTR
jgi:hypothetical protein